MKINPVHRMLGRPLRLAIIGGGPGSFIGGMHRLAQASQILAVFVLAQFNGDILV